LHYQLNNPDYLIHDGKRIRHSCPGKCESYEKCKYDRGHAVEAKKKKKKKSNKKKEKEKEEKATNNKRKRPVLEKAEEWNKFKEDNIQKIKDSDPNKYQGTAGLKQLNIELIKRYKEHIDKIKKSNAEKKSKKR